MNASVDVFFKHLSIKFKLLFSVNDLSLPPAVVSADEEAKKNASCFDSPQSNGVDLIGIGDNLADNLAATLSPPSASVTEEVEEVVVTVTQPRFCWDYILIFILLKSLHGELVFRKHSQQYMY